MVAVNIPTVSTHSVNVFNTSIHFTHPLLAHTHTHHRVGRILTICDFYLQDFSVLAREV